MKTGSAALLALFWCGGALAQEPPDLDVISKRAWEADQIGETRKALELHREAVGICDREKSSSRNCHMAYIMAAGAKQISPLERAALLAKAEAIKPYNMKGDAEILDDAQNKARSPIDRAESYTRLIMYREAILILEQEAATSDFARKSPEYRLSVLKALAANLDQWGERTNDSSKAWRARPYWQISMKIALSTPAVRADERVYVKLATAKNLGRTGEHELAFLILVDLLYVTPEADTRSWRSLIIPQMIHACGSTDRWKCVEKYSRERLDDLRRTSPDSAPPIFWTRSSLAIALAKQGKLNEARRYLVEATAGVRSLTEKQGEFDANQQKLARETGLLYRMQVGLSWRVAN